MGITEVSIIHHVGIVLLVLWLLAEFNLCHPLAYFLSLIYLYLVLAFNIDFLCFILKAYTFLSNFCFRISQKIKLLKFFSGRKFFKLEEKRKN